MNGGVHHGLECLSPDDLAAAKNGYTFLGFDSVVRVLENAPSLDEHVADEAYVSVITQDSTIDRRFAELYARSPELFAPPD
jgi:hypothetical protein